MIACCILLIIPLVAMPHRNVEGVAKSMEAAEGNNDAFSSSLCSLSANSLQLLQCTATTLLRYITDTMSLSMTMEDGGGVRGAWGSVVGAEYTRSRGPSCVVDSNTPLNIVAQALEGLAEIQFLTQGLQWPVFDHVSL